jgi:dienelactone hydrolase
MTEVVPFHHSQGLTSGVAAFADELRAAGHTVHTPDLFEGRTFGSVEQQNLFADNSLASYDPDAAKLLTRRAIEFLGSR